MKKIFISGILKNGMNASKIVFQNVSVSEMPLKFLCCAKLSLNTH
jgi:hypothetical protein